MSSSYEVPRTSITVSRWCGPERPDGSDRIMVSLVAHGNAISVRRRDVVALVVALTSAAIGDMDQDGEL